MTPLAAVALTAAGTGLAFLAARALLNWADQRMERLLHDAFTYGLDDEYQALVEAENA